MINMKGLFFIGCSFTWGQGLYYYSKLDTLKTPIPNEYNEKDITEAHKKYMSMLRFPRLVANHFNTFEIVKKHNGGSDENSIKILDNFNKSNDICGEIFSFSEIEYIIFQTTQSVRNSFYFYENNKEYSYLSYNDDNDTQKNFLTHLTKNYNSFDEWNIKHIENYYNLIIDQLKIFEEKGIKTLILSWTNDYLPFIKNNEWSNNRFISLEYNDKNYDTIEHLMNDYEDMTINSDFNHFKNPPKDHHPSLKCHQVISDSIIRKIEKLEK